MKRKLETVYKPATAPGFLGKGHTASPVIAVDFTQSDPFIMLMDDQLEKKDDIPVGGPHPHAGFETVSLVINGDFGEGEHAMKAGDFEIMTAGSGIVHTETISQPTKMRLLQLWLNLPKKDRHATPRVQRLKSEHVPGISTNGVHAKSLQRIVCRSYFADQEPHTAYHRGHQDGSWCDIHGSNSIRLHDVPVCH